MATSNRKREPARPPATPPLQTGDESVLLHSGDPGLREGAEDFRFLLKRIAGLRVGHTKADDSMALDYAGAKAWFEDVFLKVFGHSCSDTPRREGFVMALASMLLYEAHGLAVDVSPSKVLDNFDEVSVVPEATEDAEEPPRSAPNVSAQRHDLATSALYEISQAATLLRQHIAASDVGGEIMYVARGMLGRIELLSEAVIECLGGGNDWDDEQLTLIVREAHHA